MTAVLLTMGSSLLLRRRRSPRAGQEGGRSRTGVRRLSLDDARPGARARRSDGKSTAVIRADPNGSTRAARQRRDPRKGRTREDALLRSATVREPYHQLQLMPQFRAWRCRRTIDLDRASLAPWRS